MTEKVFRIISNSKEHLSADTIAFALLKQITLNSKEPNVFFGVAELQQERVRTISKEYAVSEENNLQSNR